MMVIKIFRSDIANFMIFLLLITIILALPNDNFSSVFMLGWVNLLLLVKYFFETKQNHKIYSMYFIFLILLLIFHFGQIFIFSVGLGNTIEESVISANVIKDMPISTVISSIKFSTIAVFLLNEGAQYVFKRSNDSANVEKEYERYELKLSIITGIVLLVISLPFMIMYDSSYFAYSLSSGYLGSSQLSVNYGLTDDLARLFKVSMIFLIIGNKNKKKLAYSIIIGNIMYSILKIIIIGQRGYETIFILVIIWLYFLLFKQLNLGRFIGLAVLGILFLAILSVTVIFRDGTESFGFANILSYLTNKNPIISTINEYGSSLYTVQLFIDYVPDKMDYGLGSSYVLSLLSIFPNINGILNGPLKLAYPNAILAKFVPGIGGSIIGELYYNFSYLGAIIGGIIGCLIAKLSLSAENDIKKNKYFGLGISAVIFNNLLWIIRDSASVLPRNLLFAIGIPILIKFIFPKTKK